VRALTVIPAIDLKGGKCVRLRQGRADRSTVYGEDPVAMARHWAEQGAERLHVVDLDGAFEGRPVHGELVRAIIAAVDIPVQVGGGLRADEDVESLLACGAERVIVGTRALSDEEGLSRLVRRHGARLGVGIDARGGRVRIKGWTEETGRDAIELARRVDALGAATIIYTDTAVDGMLAGPNVSAVDALCRAVACKVIASGGISTAGDVRRLADLGCPNLAGVIVGKALYEERVTLAELHAAGALKS